MGVGAPSRGVGSDRPQAQSGKRRRTGWACHSLFSGAQCDSECGSSLTQSKLLDDDGADQGGVQTQPET